MLGNGNINILQVVHPGAENLNKIVIAFLLRNRSVILLCCHNVKGSKDTVSAIDLMRRDPCTGRNTTQTGNREQHLTEITLQQYGGHGIICRIVVY